MFVEHLQKHNHSIALIDEDQREYSYLELSQIASSIAATLRNEDSLVFNLCLNSVTSIASYFACLDKINFAQLLLSHNINDCILVDLIESYKPTYIFMPSDRSTPQGYTLLKSMGKFDILESLTKYNHSIHTDLCLLLSTSGSTGTPKLVKISRQNLMSNACSINEYLQISSRDRPVTTLPMSYALGLSIINSHLIAGACVVLNNLSVTDRGFFDVLDKLKPTTFGGVPFTFEMLDRVGFTKKNFPYLRYLCQAGGKLKKHTFDSFTSYCLQNDIKFYVMYGQTEATARMSYVPWKFCIEKRSSIGIPIPGGKLSLIAEDKSEVCSDGEIGELVYTGANVSMGYSLGPVDLSEPDQNKGTLYTGDLAKRDSDGFYEIVGRKKRFLKICGTRFQLDHIEEYLYESGVISACTGVDESLIVFITNESSTEFVKNILISNFSLNLRYFSIKIIKEIPRNEYGKVDFAQLLIESGLEG